jgi:hypothetical protein
MLLNIIGDKMTDTIKFPDYTEVAGRSYSRFKHYGTFSTTQDVVNKYKESYYIDEGIVRWLSNDQIPFGDVLLDLTEAGLINIHHLVDSCIAKEEETDKFWSEVTKERFKCPETGEDMIRFVHPDYS